MASGSPRDNQTQNGRKLHRSPWEKPDEPTKNIRLFRFFFFFFVFEFHTQQQFWSWKSCVQIEAQHGPSVFLTHNRLFLYQEQFSASEGPHRLRLGMSESACKRFRAMWSRLGTTNSAMIFCTAHRRSINQAFNINRSF